MPEKEVRLIDARKISNDIALYLAENSYLNSTALDALTMVFRWVREAPTIDPESLRPQWISVDDRLPETIPCAAGTEYSEAVIVWTDGKKAMIAVWNGSSFLCAADYWEAWGEKITHWMPLPEPPKEEADPFYNEANQNGPNKTIAAYENGEE